MLYDRLDLHVFSGTGNTFRVAQWMAERGRAQGIAEPLNRLRRLEGRQR